MAKKKELRFQNKPIDAKTVKLSSNPESYKRMHICWQFGLMDFDFIHGWGSVIERLRFTNEIKQELLISLLESPSTNDELYNIIDQINLKDYLNLSDFFSCITKNTTISFDDHKIISKHIRNNFFWDHLYPKLKEIESKLWWELETEQFGKQGKSKNHWVNTSAIIKDAQQRLQELKMDDIEELYSIRLTATNRIWGIRDYNYYKILWFDFDHEICPSLK